MKKEQAEAAADSLLHPERQRQQAVQARRQSQSAWLQGLGQRAWRACALLGLLSGGAIGHFGYDNLGTGLIAGFAVGSAIGAVARIVANRRPAP